MGNTLRGYFCTQRESSESMCEDLDGEDGNRNRLENNLIKALQKDNNSELESSLEKYLEGIQLSGDKLAMNHILVERVRTIVESTSGMLECQYELKAALKYRSYNTVVDALRKYLKFTSKVLQTQLDQRLIRDAKQFIKEERQGVSRGSSLSGVSQKDFRTIKGSVASTPGLSEAATKRRRTSGVSTASENLDKDKPAKFKSISQDKEKLYEALHQDDISLMKQELNRYSMNPDPDWKFVNKAKHIISTKAEYRQHVVEKNRKLLQQLVNATYNMNLQKISSALKDYERYCEQHSPVISLDRGVVIQAKVIISQLESEVEAVKREHEAFRNRLTRASQLGNPGEVEYALEKYELFAKYRGYVIDDKLVEKAKKSLLLSSMEKNRDELKRKLVEANESGDTELMKDALSKYRSFLEESGTGDDPLVEQIETKLTTSYCQTLLDEAIHSNDVEKLKWAIDHVKTFQVVDEVKEKCKKASVIMEKIEHGIKTKSAIMNLDRAQLHEIRDYSNPPPVVHELMVAILLLLGYSESETRDWATCQKLCCSYRTPTYQGLIKSIQDFELVHLNPAIAKRAQQILEVLTPECVRATSHAASLLYAWAVATCERCLENADCPTPATGTRQNSILASMGKQARQ